MVDEDEITEIFQFRLDGVDKVTGVISFAELAVGRGFARCCGEVGSAEDNYFFHCFFLFWGSATKSPRTVTILFFYSYTNIYFFIKQSIYL